MAQFRGHNEAVLRTLEVGDLVEFDRVLFTHWGVYVGSEEIVHLTVDDKSGKGFVKREGFWSVAGQNSVEKNNSKDGKSLCPNTIKERALSRLGKSPYDMLIYNCEHFANWCRYDEIESAQADSVRRGTPGFWGTIGAFLLVPMRIFTSVSNPSSSSSPSSSYSPSSSSSPSSSYSPSSSSSPSSTSSASS